LGESEAIITGVSHNIFLSKVSAKYCTCVNTAIVLP